MVMYDDETANGIPYIKGLYWSKFEYRTVVDDLDALYPTKRRLLTEGNAKSYPIGSRSLTRTTMSAKEILAEWDRLMAEKARLEGGHGKSYAVGIVMRDW